MLLWLLAVPVLVAAYVLLLRRRKKSAVRYASLSLMREAIGPDSMPPSRSSAAVPAGVDRGDHRDRAAERGDHAAVAGADDRARDGRVAQHGRQGRRPQSAHRRAGRGEGFIEEHPPNARIAIVAFGATASLVQTPTQNQEDLLAAIDRFQLQRGTATGSALYLALATLFPDAGIDLESLVFKGGLSSDSRPTRSPDPPSPKQEVKERSRRRPARTPPASSSC